MFAHYVSGQRWILALANVNIDDLRTVEAGRSLVRGTQRFEETCNSDDLPDLRRLASTMNAILTEICSGREDRAMKLLNAAMEKHPPRPSMTFASDRWHLHLQPRRDRWTTELATAVTMELAMFLSHFGPHRVGRCDAEPCTNFFLDSTKNESKRFCSTRCANRATVRAFRRRRDA